MAGDFDGDGDIDLAVSLAASDRVAVLRNAGNGTFGAPSLYTVGDSPGAMAVGDLDRDGDLDLAVVNEQSGYLSILRNAGNGTFTSAVSVPVPIFGSMRSRLAMRTAMATSTWP